MTLLDLQKSKKRVVSHFTNQHIGGKLMCMGLKPGSTIQIIRKTKGSQTLYVKANNHRLAIRANEAAVIALMPEGQT